LWSRLWNTGLPASWKGSEIQSVAGTPDEWPELANPRALPENELTREVLKVIRNALSHGNLYTRGPSSQIREIVFVSGMMDPSTGRIEQWRFVQVSPDDFHKFLTNWFSFLMTLRLPERAVAQAFDDAA